MLSRHRSTFRVFPLKSLTALSALMVMTGIAAFTWSPASAVVTDTVQAAAPPAPIPSITPVVTATASPLHAEHMAHLAHMAYLDRLAQEQAAAAAAAQAAKVSPDTFSPSTPAAMPSTPAAVPSTPVTGYSGIQACIIRTESGGDPQIMNATGHYGLYQFSYATWTAHGGNPADFGHASVAEQNQVFANTVAVDGYSDWTPYDGC